MLKGDLKKNKTRLQKKLIIVIDNADELEKNIMDKGKGHKKLTWGADQYFPIPKRHKKKRNKKTQSITNPARKNSQMSTQK